jgi:hypothetical protein
VARQFRNWCTPKPQFFSWFFLKENHSSPLLQEHGNCETAQGNRPPAAALPTQNVFLRS